MCFSQKIDICASLSHNAQTTSRTQRRFSLGMHGFANGCFRGLPHRRKARECPEQFGSGKATKLREGTNKPNITMTSSTCPAMCSSRRTQVEEVHQIQRWIWILRCSSISKIPAMTAYPCSKVSGAELKNIVALTATLCKANLGFRVRQPFWQWTILSSRPGTKYLFLGSSWGERTVPT